MNWKDELRKFESDNSSGSAELLEQFMALLIYWMEREELQTARDKIFLMEQMKRLQESHRSLLVLLHFSSKIIQLLNTCGDDWKDEFVDFLHGYRDDWIGVNQRLALQAGSVVDLSQKTILCHSQSSAVRELFAAYGGNRKKIRILQTESRPILEGRIQAVNLHKLGFEVKLITDNGYVRHLDRINLVLLGADAVFRDYFVNKTGSYSICLAAKNAGIPVFILADSRKFWFSLFPEHKDIQYNENKKPVEEIWKDPHPGIDVENFYFEKIPVGWADGFITEKDILKPSQLQKYPAE
jgi:translation initiation factor 2B subunit (eIF-2B alpha/beta/delta family)